MLLPGCVIDINNNLSEPQPLLVRPLSTTVLQPQGPNSLIRLHHGEQIELICSDSFTAPFKGHKGLLVRCIQNQTFSVAGNQFHFTAFKCNSYPKHIARRTGAFCYNGNGTMAEIGFDIAADRFLHVMNVCLNEAIQNTYYAHFRLGPGNHGHQRNFPRPDFEVGMFFNHSKDFRFLYTRRNQRLTFGRLLGEQVVPQLFNDSTWLFLARGHLMAKSDNVLGNQQRSTFYYINAAPQWQSFNGGNWAKTENALRDFVGVNNLYVQVYTGTFGIFSLLDCSGKRTVDVYLDIQRWTKNDCSGRGPIPRPWGRLPVPLFYYKVVLNEFTDQGVALIGLNNPHATEADIRSGKYDLCPDVSDQIDWMENSWNRTNIHLGYSYACEVNTFVKVVDHLPSTVRAGRLLK